LKSERFSILEKSILLLNEKEKEKEREKEMSILKGVRAYKFENYSERKSNLNISQTSELSYIDPFKKDEIKSGFIDFKKMKKREDLFQEKNLGPGGLHYNPKYAYAKQNYIAKLNNKYNYFNFKQNYFKI